MTEPGNLNLSYHDSKTPSHSSTLPLFLPYTLWYHLLGKLQYHCLVKGGLVVSFRLITQVNSLVVVFVHFLPYSLIWCDHLLETVHRMVLSHWGYHVVLSCNWCTWDFSVAEEKGLLSSATLFSKFQYKMINCTCLSIILSFAMLHDTMLLYHVTWFSSVQSLSHVWLFATPWTTACQASLSIANSQSPPKPCLLSRWCHPTILSSVVPFSCPQSFPASGSFPVSQLFASGGQSIGVLASTSASTSFQWIPRTDLL